MYTFQLTNKFLSDEEKGIFNDYLSFLGLDSSIWEVFASLFASGTKYTKPLLLKVYKDSELYGAGIILKCSRYGKSLFKNNLLAGFINLLHLPSYIWIKFGCCMDMMSNTGFVQDPGKVDEVIRAMIKYLKENTLLTLVNDYSINAPLYANASVLPALPHALIDTSAMSSVNHYIHYYKNLQHKMNTFRNKGGEFIRVEHQLSREQVSSLKRCFLSTAEQSVFYLPYQDLYLRAALNTGRTYINNVHYFIARLNGKFIGYQAALKTGDKLNALHGAFDRNLRTNYHAYDILFVHMTEFAIQNGLKSIDFGAVLNETKQRMVNTTIDMSYFVMSRYSFIQKVFNLFLKLTRIQGQDQMRFRKPL